MGRDQIPSANLPKVFNKTLVTLGNEETQVIHTPGVDRDTVKGIQIKSRTTANSLQYGFEPGGPYTTIPGGNTYAMWNLDIGQAFTVYLVGSIDGQVAEIEVWR